MRKSGGSIHEKLSHRRIHGGGKDSEVFFVGWPSDHLFCHVLYRLSKPYFKLKDEHTVVGGYDKCYCGLVNKTKKPFKNLTYCYCGAGHIKQFFESALEKPVQVKLEQSVIAGAKNCKFLIHI